MDGGRTEYGTFGMLVRDMIDLITYLFNNNGFVIGLYSFFAVLLMIIICFNFRDI